MNQTLDTNFKGGLMITLSQVLYKNQINRESFHYKICKEFYSLVPVTIFFPKNNYLVENVSKKLEAFASSGLIEYWSSFHMNMKYFNFKWTISGPKKLSMNHLSGTFQILIFGLIVSVLFFINELFWHQIIKFRETKKLSLK